MCICVRYEIYYVIDTNICAQTFFLIWRRDNFYLLPPLMFLLYVNNLPNNVKSSRVAIFADDTKVFNAVQSPNDAVMLQEDISNLVNR